MAMPWTEARAWLAALERRRVRRLLELSLAMRAAQADEKGWRAWCARMGS